MAKSLSPLAGTFRTAKNEPVHRWFPWIEGFSDAIPRDAIERHAPDRVYDPFLGSGTTAVVTLRAGAFAGGAEVNPFLRFVTRIKTVTASRLAQEPIGELEERFEGLADRAEVSRAQPSLLNGLFAEADYFEKAALRDISRTKAAIDTAPVSALDKEFALLALSRTLVDSSNMIRRADLRRRRGSETNGQGKKILPRFRMALQNMVEDLATMEPAGEMGRVLPDARMEPEIGDPSYDLCVTSPPYLNGTNYVRNTKLEMWVLDLISTPRDLRDIRDRGVTAGINNVRLATTFTQAPSRRLDGLLAALAEVAYDPRIPALVAGYFEDMSVVLKATTMRLRPGSHIYLDIGDSKFAGVHIPTDQILSELAADIDLDLLESVKLRDRRSNDGTPLVQRLLVLQTPKNRGRRHVEDAPERRLERLVRTRPFGNAPFAARNWGHPWHSMCSYQAKLKPSIAHFLVKEFSQRNDVVLDPFSGAGTIPLEACLQGRSGWGNDISPLATRLTAAKVVRADAGQVRRDLDALLDWVDEKTPDSPIDPISAWGMNRSLGEYFHPRTLAEIVAARTWFLGQEANASINLLWSASAHLLHGNRPYALSRRSHPITPFAPTGPTEYRPLRPRLADKIDRLLAADPGGDWADGHVSTLDVSNLDHDGTLADVVLTSPPFFGSTRFHVNNWMRIWFCGWEPEHFDVEREQFLEYRQAQDFSAYEEVFAAVHNSLRPDGIAVWHLGKSRRFDMGAELSRLADPWFSVEGCFDEDVTACQSHGVSSQGTTNAHQFLLLRSR